MPNDVKLLPGQLLGIQETVRDVRAPPLPNRPPLPSFESPYARIDGDSDSEPEADSAAAAAQQPDTAQANDGTER